MVLPDPRGSLLRRSSSQSYTQLQAGWDILLRFETSYEDLVVTFGADDLLICFTDGISDATDDKGRALGVDGLLELARGLSVESPMAAGATLLGLVDAFRHGAPASDDETLIVLRRSAQ